MSMVLAQPFESDEVYPERPEVRAEPLLDRVVQAVSGRISRAWRARPRRIRAIPARVERAGADLAAMDHDALRGAVREVRRRLRIDGLRDELVPRTFAVIREMSGRVNGMRHFDVQLIGGYIMLNGMVAEMHTGEGKTLTATLPAAAAALAGVPVHVITVNDYLVARDCELMRPLYEALGLTVAAVTEEMEHEGRQAAYACDVVYCSNKTVVFDYLRDRLLLAASSSDLHLRLEKLHGTGTRIRKLLLRGLHFAIVDEADSVLADEARTPLIISAEVSAPDEEKVAAQALGVARALVADEDYRILLAERRVVLTEAGHRRMTALTAPLGGVWAGSLRREELVIQSLTALHLYELDEHYMLRDGKVVVIDEFTGRTMADRSWGQGLHQLIETKEGLAITARREPLARISYQRFFRRYRNLSGMTGTAAEVAGELGAVYGLAVARVPTHRPSRRVHGPTRMFATEAEKWRCIAARVADLHARGVPVLLGTRSVATSEEAGNWLAARGLAFQVLNAKQDKDEADLVARAGELGRITLATNMAGRGTDIKLGPGVAEAGGLHVILSERHEAARIDRQLAGRSARQGDPGGFEAVLSLEDALLEPYRDGLAARLLRTFARPGTRLGEWCLARWVDHVQAGVERGQSRLRRGLLKADRQMSDILSFSGRAE